MSHRTGLLTATEIGRMLPRGAGPGWAMSLGVLRRTTTAVGTISDPTGVGALDRFTPIPSMGQRSLGWLGGFGFGFGFGWGGGYGWFPLGWGEPYHPWYHCGWGYYHNVNVHNAYFHNFNGRGARYHQLNYAYAHNTHAVTTASHNTFVNGQAHQSRCATSERSCFAQCSGDQRHSRYAQRARVLSAQPTCMGTWPLRRASVENRSVMARSTPAAAASHLAVHTMNTSGIFGRARDYH